MRLFLGVLIGAVLLGAAAIRAQDARKDQELLQGTWVMTAKEFMGKKAPEEEIKKLGTRVVVKGETATVSSLDAGESVVVSESTIKLDPTTKPKSMDLMVTSGPAKGKTGLAIYELDGDTLKVCYAIDEGKRPTRFAGPPDNEWIFAVYKREKK